MPPHKIQATSTTQRIAFFSTTMDLRASHFARICPLLALLLILAAGAGAKSAQPKASAAPSGSVRGLVLDTTGHPAADAVVFLQHATEIPGKEGTPTQAIVTQRVRTNGKGAFTFVSLSEGRYTLHAERTASERTPMTRIALAPDEAKTVNLTFESPKAPEADSSPVSSNPEFFDEPNFTVAGVTQAPNSAGHGSDAMVRNSEALVKATGALGKDSADTTNRQLPATSSPSQPGTLSDSPQSADNHSLDEKRAALRARILPDADLDDDSKRQQQADLHDQLARLDEALGDPLDAVHQYQRAAALDPTEPHVFDWATELLTHGALEPATEIFTQGTQHYPQSVRMLLGLGVTWYARGNDERASRFLVAASDLAPNDPGPYLFIGKRVTVESAPSSEYLDRLARFARIAPENALANYYYALALWKHAQSEAVPAELSHQVEGLLQRAVQLDPHLSAAHLQLGILYAQRGDNPRAISAYLDAIIWNPQLEEAHYRLAQAYRRAGDDAAARKELELYTELSRKSKEQAARDRHEIQQFVVSLRDQPNSTRQ
jgi:tetratricopeptide (TPR) repeat protein